MARPSDPIRDFPGKRWLNMLLRTIHIVGVVLFGAALLGAGSPPLGATVILASGLSMLAIDTWSKPEHLCEIAGFGVLLKLALIGLISVLQQLALPAFWILVVFSTLLAHAPGHIRHRRLF